MTIGQLTDWATMNPGANIVVDTGIGLLIDNSWSWHLFAFANDEGPDAGNMNTRTSFNIGVLTTVDAPVNPLTTGQQLRARCSRLRHG